MQKVSGERVGGGGEGNEDKKQVIVVLPGT